MEVRNLSNSSFDEVLDCFLLAFEDYYVTMPTDRNYFKQRWKAAKVDFKFSYGVFDGGRLVAFIIHAVDRRNKLLTAFNTGTGVIPEYRGKRLVKSIYGFAIEDLKSNGFERSTLEVITENEKAIRAYESVGFKICKKYACYAGKLTANTVNFQIRETALRDVQWDRLTDQQTYSWDFQKETVSLGNYRFFEVLSKGIPESYFILNPDNFYLAQFDVYTNDSDQWNRLFAAIGKISTEVKIINVDRRKKEKIEKIQLLGLKNTLDQYEMELDLTSIN